MNILIEFIKWRNWLVKVVEELKDFFQIFDVNGCIKYVFLSIFNVFGYLIEEIQDVFFKDLIYFDDQGVFVVELNEFIVFGNFLCMFYCFKKKDGVYMIFEVIGYVYIVVVKFVLNFSN